MNQPVTAFRLNLYMVLGTMFLHGLVMLANELFFQRAEFVQGIGWIYLPAGTRLLCTLLFGRAGALGLLIVGWFACYWYYFPGDAVRATTGAMAGAIGPYLIYLIARERYGLQASLTNLTPRRLLLCALGCALASPLLHHIWFFVHDDALHLPGFLVMFVGDLAGALIVLYTAKWLLSLVRRQATSRREDRTVC
ncbi:hypothetical protein [Massilia sp. MS-15]|uniref:hypothetical protein n=1 Tax=Massilia sp. MS-15 TaxID=2878200 RepID=UPI001CD36BEE|nr:hypothetical protein [Massilia sp. MS-15]MCA1246029.1 hypothetical protein [Massilia sp. MS-15]